MYKQVIVINKDVKMSKGKVAAQASHASVSAMQKCDKDVAKKWRNEGQKKVVVKASLVEFENIAEKCAKLKIPFDVIRDAGLTEIEAGTATAIGIGPDEETKIDKVTGSLALL